MGKFFTQNGLWAMEKLRMVPKGTFDIGESLKVAGNALVEGGQTKLFTWVDARGWTLAQGGKTDSAGGTRSPMALWVVRKVG